MNEITPLWGFYQQRYAPFVICARLKTLPVFVPWKPHNYIDLFVYVGILVRGDFVALWQIHCLPPLDDGVDGVVCPWESISCESNSLSSFFNSASFQFEFFTIVATWLRDLRSVETPRNFSAPSFIFSSFRISRLMISFSSSSLPESCESEMLSVGRPYLCDSSYRTGCLM